MHNFALLQLVQGMCDERVPLSVPAHPDVVYLQNMTDALEWAVGVETAALHGRPDAEEHIEPLRALRRALDVPSVRQLSHAWCEEAVRAACVGARCVRPLPAVAGRAALARLAALAARGGAAANVNCVMRFMNW